MKDLRQYVRPETPEEAVKLKAEHGPRAVYLGGGTDLLVHNPATVDLAIDIRHCGLGFARQEGQDYVIGGGALLRTAETAVTDVAGGMLTAALRDTAPWLIRNAATVAGNIANASPAADSVPALLVLDAELALLDGQEERVPLADIFEGPHRTALGDRLIREIRIGPAAAKRRGVFIKLARSASDIAQVNVAVAANVEVDAVRNVRIALGAVAPTPIRIPAAEELLEGRQLDPQIVQRVEAVVREEVRPISDWRASAEYRRRMSGVLVRRALEAMTNSTERDVDR